MNSSLSPVSSPPRTPSSTKSVKMRSPGLTYAQAVANGGEARNIERTAPDATQPITQDINVHHVPTPKAHDPIQQAENLEDLPASPANSYCQRMGNTANHDLTPQNSDPIMRTCSPTDVLHLRERLTTCSVIDIDELASDDGSVFLVTTPIKREESPYELGKRHRLLSPSPSLLAPSVPPSPSKPARRQRGRKAARLSTTFEHNKENPDGNHQSGDLATAASPDPTEYPSQSMSEIEAPQPSLSGRNLIHDFTRDIQMRSPSPSHSDLLRDRIPRHEKGKDRHRPTPGPSMPNHTFGAFLNEPTISTTVNPVLSGRRVERTPSMRNIDDSTGSVYPPVPSKYRVEFPFRTPIPRFPRIDTAQADPHRPYPQNMQPPPSARSDVYPHRARTPTLRTAVFPHSFQLTEDDYDIRKDDESSALRQYVQQQTENAPAELDDSLQFTPVPPGGFPKIHYSSPLAHLDNIDDDQLLDWEREQALGLVAVGMSFWGHGALDGDIDSRFRQLLSYAAHVLNARFHTDRIMVAKPKPKTKVTQVNAAPYTTLVYGLQLSEAKTLCEEGVMCTPKLGIFFHNLDIAFPSYVGAIHGLTTRLIQPVYELVIDHFLTTEAESLFQDLTKAARRPMTLPDDAQAYFTSSLYVWRLDCRAKGNTLAPVFLIYIQSPATDYHTHRKWQAFCRTINLSHSLYGSGILKSPGTCAGCHGHDHPTGLCRFTSVPNWCAPDPYHTPNFSIPAPIMAANRDQTRGNAPRRGRGGGADNRTRRRRQGNRD